MNGIKLILLSLLLFTTGCSLTGELVVSYQHEDVVATYKVATR